MKNSIKGVHISEEIKQLLVQGKVKVDISDYPAIEEYMRTNKTASKLVEKVASSEYPEIDEQYKTNQVECFFQIINRKQQDTRRRRIIISATSVAAALLLLSFLIIPTKKENSVKNIETIVANNFPTLILENGISIDLSKVTPDSLKKIEVTSKNTSIYNVITIPNHYTYNITLNDGTEVYLNACTELRYPKTFIGDERVVELKGEAFFKVTKSSKPFIIKTDATSVKVYGTEFNIFTNSKVTETILVKGSIGITQKGSTQEILILPNERHTLRDGIAKVEPIDAVNSIGWLNNEFNFSNIYIDDLLTKISEWYGVSFEVTLNDLDNIAIDISSPRTIAIEQLIEVIESSTKLQFIKESKNKYNVKLKL